MTPRNDSEPLLVNEDEDFPISPKRKIIPVMIANIKQHRSIILWCIASLLTSALQGVYIKLAGSALGVFPYFLFWTTALPFVILFFIFYWIVLLWARRKGRSVGKTAQWKMAIIGGLNALNGIFILFSNPHVPGVMQALLGPTIVVIPMAMALSFVMLKSRYNRYQVLAVFVILLGLGIAMFPSFYSLRGSSGGEEQFGSVFWNIVFLLGSVPAAFQTVYQEKAFASEPIDLAFMLAYSTLWQFIAIVVSFPVDAIPHFGTASSFLNIFSNQREGFNCLLNRPTAETLALCAGQCDCEHAGLYVGLFVIAYVTSGFTSLGVVKYGNATFSFIVATLSTPLTEFAFAWPLLMGSQVETISPYNYGALAVLLIGVILYRVFDRAATAKHISVVIPKHPSVVNEPHVFYSYDSGAYP